MIYHGGGESVPRQRISQVPREGPGSRLCLCRHLCLCLLPDDNDEDGDEVMCWGPPCPRPCWGPHGHPSGEIHRHNPFPGTGWMCGAVTLVASGFAEPGATGVWLTAYILAWRGWRCVPTLARVGEGGRWSETGADRDSGDIRKSDQGAIHPVSPCLIIPINIISSYSS